MRVLKGWKRIFWSNQKEKVIVDIVSWFFEHSIEVMRSKYNQDLILLLSVDMMIAAKLLFKVSVPAFR